MKKCNALIIFLFGGFVFRYGLDFMEMLVTHFSNLQTLSASKLQCEIAELSKPLENEEDSGQAIGFEIYPQEEIYEDEYDE